MAKKYDSLSDIWKLKKRGQRDSDRHKELVRDAIKKHGKDLITEYDLIRSDGDKKIKVPIKFLDKYRFKYGRLKDNGGVGHGSPGKPGDKFKVKEGSDSEDGQAGDKKGERVYDAEITVDELVDILLEELNLPWMDPKNSTEVEVEKDEVTSISKKGIYPNIDLKRSLLENIKRNAAKGNPKVGKFKNEDLRYQDWEVEKEHHSNAAVYCLLDRSGSMTKDKTYIAKSFYFWMVQFLKRRYKKVELVFIAHDVEAFIVEEQDFFKISSSGGTKCSSALKLAYEHMKTNHPPDRYNNYVMMFSDGDNYMNDNMICLDYANKMMDMVRAIGYGEVMLESRGGWLKPELMLSTVFSKNINRTRFLSMQFKSKDDVFKGLRRFFNVDNVSKKLKDSKV